MKIPVRDLEIFPLFSQNVWNMLWIFKTGNLFQPEKFTVFNLKFLNVKIISSNLGQMAIIGPFFLTYSPGFSGPTFPLQCPRLRECYGCHHHSGQPLHGASSCQQSCGCNDVRGRKVIQPACRGAVAWESLGAGGTLTAAEAVGPHRLPLGIRAATEHCDWDRWGLYPSGTFSLTSS